MKSELNSWGLLNRLAAQLRRRFLVCVFLAMDPVLKENLDRGNRKIGTSRRRILDDNERMQVDS